MSNQIKNKEAKLSLFSNDIILYVANPQPLPKPIHLFTLINEFSKVAVYKISIKKSAVLLHVSSKLSEIETKKVIPFIIPTDIYLRKFNHTYKTL